MDFTDEEIAAIAAIDLAKLKAVLPAEQFEALAKFVTCFGGYTDLKEGSRKQ